MAERRRQYLILADEDLISLVEAADAEAFATLYDRHSRAAFSLAYRMMGERQASEDLTQDAFLKVWRAASSYRADRGSVRAWLLSIVRNCSIDQIRSQASRRRTQERIEASAPRSQPSEAFSEAWRNSQRQQVREALSTLPPEHFKILELAYFSGYTHVELSDLLGLPLGTVKGRMRLGLKKIRDYFEHPKLTRRQIARPDDKKRVLSNPGREDARFPGAGREDAQVFAAVGGSGS
ncbi:MAG TPA: sigma-70 family RNA polymerase sigma factor [Rubrobacter sp.]|nr:sigma-70 family RNA polymerase sigma factor [Rubrobacter sp.]